MAKPGNAADRLRRPLNADVRQLRVGRDACASLGPLDRRELKCESDRWDQLAAAVTRVMRTT